MNKNEIINLLNEYNLKPKKGFGQNFLTSENALQKIVQAAGVSGEDCVVEVGPGLGVLTIKLAEKAKKVTAVELDKSIAEILNSKLKPYKNVEIKNLNALDFNPPYEKYKLVANIPYYITSPLISHFLKNRNRPEKIVLLIQNEVAEKICAKEGKLNVLAIHVQIFGTPKIIAKVKSNSFYPEPKVDSAILSVDVYDKPKVPEEKIDNFLKIVHAGFSHRRKTIINALFKKLDYDKSEIEDVLNKCNVQLSSRAQHLKIEDWLCISNHL